MNRFVLLQKNYGERKLAVHRFHFEDAYEQNRSLENYISMDRSNAYRPRDDEHGYAGKLLKRVDIERRFADGSQALVRLPSRDDEQPSSFREAERLEAGRAQAFCERRDGGGSPYPLTPFEEEAQRKPNDQEILRRAEQVVTRQRAEDRAQAPQIRAPAGECLQATGRRVRGRSPAPDQRGDEGSGWGRGKPATPYSATVLNQNKKGGESRLIFFSTLRNPLPLLRPWYSPSNGGLMAGGFFNRISGRIFKRAATDSKDEASMVTASQQAHEHQPASASAPMPTDDEIKSVLERLIGPGVKANFKHANGDEPLHYAAFKGDLEASRLLIAAGADVNARGQQGMTPLHMSIYGRNPDVSDLLLASGSNPALKDNNGQVAGYMDRALYDESRKNREEGFKARVGVDPSDPIFHAENLQQLKQALAEGASVRDTDVLGRNPL